MKVNLKGRDELKVEAEISGDVGDMLTRSFSLVGGWCPPALWTGLDFRKL